MSQFLIDLTDALKIIRETRKQVSVHDDFQWSKLWHADRHLEKQLNDYFKEEVAVPAFIEVNEYSVVAA